MDRNDPQSALTVVEHGAAGDKPRTLREGRLDLAAMMTTQPEPIDCVLRGLPLGTVGVILGSGGVGKSMLILHAAHAVATGHDDVGCLLGDDHATGRVVYLAGEDCADILHHRLHAFGENLDARRRAGAVRAMADMVDIIPLVGSAPNILDGGGLLVPDAVAQIRTAAVGARLLVLDPLRQFHGADENDNGAMTTLSKALARIAHEERCSIVIAHHVSKAGARDEEGDAAMSRGATAITDNARWVMALAKMSKTAHGAAQLPDEPWRYLTERLVKANYTEIGRTTVLVRRAGGVLGPAPVAQHGLTATVFARQPHEGARDNETLPRTAADLLAVGDDYAA